MFNKRKKGFGLLEVLVSSTIIIIVIGTVVSIGSASMKNNEYLQQRAQAIYIAQLGIERVRFMRDSNWIDGRSDTNWKTLICDGVSGYSALPASTGGNYQINTNSDDGGRFCLSGYNATSPSPSVFDVQDTGYLLDIVYKPVTDSQSIVPSGSLVQGSITENAAYFTARVRFTDIYGKTHSWESGSNFGSIEATELLTNWRPNY